jgi:hypothetical protein
LEAYILPVPGFVSLPAFVDVPTNVVAAPGSPAFNSVEKAPLRNAIDVPGGLNVQAKGSAIPSFRADILKDSPRLPPCVATRVASVSGRWPQQLIISKPPAREGLKTTPNPAVAERASTPSWAVYKPPARKEVNTIGAPKDLWATYYPRAWEATRALSGSRKPWPLDKTLANFRSASPALAADDEVPVGATNRTLAPSVRSATQSVAPLPTPRPATVAPRPVRRQPAPIAPAGTSTTVGQVQQPAASPNRAAPSSRVVRVPRDEPEVPSPKP